MLPHGAEYARMSARAAGSVARDLLALTKPRITLMVTATGVMGLLATPERAPGWRLTAALVGTALVVAGANVLNMWIERDSDALMERTRDRPLASGRIAPGVGLAFGLALSALAMPILAAAGLSVAILGAVALVTYLGIYTPMKRRSRWSLPAGAIAGAMPPVMGWATASCSVYGGVYLFVVLFAWQLPHFVAIALFRGEEYARAGLAVGAVGSSPVERAKRELVVLSVAFAAITLAAPLFGFGGVWVFVTAAVTGAGLVALAIRAARARAQRSAWRDVFAYTMGHLAIVLAAFALGR